MIDEMRPGVYDVTIREQGEARYRVFVFDGDHPTIVDTGFPDTVDVVADALSDPDIEPERVVLTHGDPDHVGGLAGFVDRFDVESWVPEGLTLEGDVEPDYRYGDGDTVGQFTAVHVPGHAPEHHALVDEDAGVAVLGDAVFGSDARGLPPGHFVLPTAYFSVDVAAADENLEALLEYDFEVGLVYHGSNVTENASEKLRSFVDFVGKPE